jgi:hypothetical protein
VHLYFSSVISILHIYVSGVYLTSYNIFILRVLWSRPRHYDFVYVASSTRIAIYHNINPTNQYQSVVNGYIVGFNFLRFRWFFSGFEEEVEESVAADTELKFQVTAIRSYLPKTRVNAVTVLKPRQTIEPAVIIIISFFLNSQTTSLSICSEGTKCSDMIISDLVVLGFLLFC